MLVLCLGYVDTAEIFLQVLLIGNTEVVFGGFYYVAVLPGRSEQNFPEKSLKKKKHKNSLNTRRTTKYKNTAKFLLCVVTKKNGFMLYQIGWLRATGEGGGASAYKKLRKFLL